MDAKVKSKVQYVVNNLHITDPKTVEGHVKGYVKNDLYRGRDPPTEHNQRFFPRRLTLKNFIDKLLADNL